MPHPLENISQKNSRILGVFKKGAPEGQKVHFLKKIFSDLKRALKNAYKTCATPPGICFSKNSKILGVFKKRAPGGQNMHFLKKLFPNLKRA